MFNILKCFTDTDEDNGDMVTIPNIWISPQKNVQVDDSGSKFYIFHFLRLGERYYRLSLHFFVLVAINRFQDF